MKTRFILAILIATLFTIMGCGSSSNIGSDSNESNEEELGGEQYVNGVAFLGHDVETGTHFTQRLKHKSATDHHPIMGEVLAKTPYDDQSHDDHHYEAMTPIWVGGRQYVMGISSEHTDNKGYYYFIQLIFPSGDFGPITDHGYWGLQYKTLIALTSPNGTVYIYLQEDGNNNQSTTHEVLPGGKLAGGNADWIKRDHYYNATTPIPRIIEKDTTKHTCFYAEDSDEGNHWIIDCIHDDGTFFSSHNPPPDHHPHDWGTWDNGHQVALSYTNGGRTHLFLHRKHYSGGPWKFKNITYDTSVMGSETESGTWDSDNYYKTMMVFLFEGMDYLIGHNTDKDWFIQHVSSYGRMNERIQSGGPWDNYYEHLFPIDFDTSYLSTHNWMERMFDEIEGFGDRKLSQIALPASHDSGMNGRDIHGCNLIVAIGGRACNTQTQRTDIRGQLSLGARYFDIRPIIDSGETGSGPWTTGHVSNVFGVTVGCRGETKSSIIDSLNDFFADSKHKKELVILKVSHCASSPDTDYLGCTDDQKNTMAHNLASQLGNHVVKGDLNLNDMTLEEILAKGNIILVVQNARDTANGIFQWGYGGDGDYYVYDEYSNTEEFNVMVNGGTNNSGDTVPGQIAKLLDLNNHAGHNHYNGFLLSWTLTLSGYDAGKCPIGSPPDILDMADKAQPRIYEYMYKEAEAGKITKSLFPNLLYVDTFNRTTTNAAIYLNRKYDSLKD